MGDIADLVISVTVGMILTHVHNTEPGLTLVFRVTVGVHFTLAGVISQVTDGSGVLAVKSIIGASYLFNKFIVGSILILK